MYNSNIKEKVKMDYNKLTNDLLRELLNDRDIKYSKGTNKEGLVSLLENNDKTEELSNEYNQNKINPKGGAITTIVLSSISLIFGSLFAIVFLISMFTIIFLGGQISEEGASGFGVVIFIMIFEFILLFLFFIAPIISIVVNSRYIKGKDNKISAGVWGLLFGGIIGGILTLCGV